jgi:hypothetical protein
MCVAAYNGRRRRFSEKTCCAAETVGVDRDAVFFACIVELVISHFNDVFAMLNREETTDSNSAYTCRAGT